MYGKTCEWVFDTIEIASQCSRDKAYYYYYENLAICLQLAINMCEQE